MERKRSGLGDRSKRVPSGAAVLRAGVTDALARAFFEEWARRGLAALSLEEVARRAGVGKAALYRRWPDRTTMAADLLSGFGLDLTAIEDQGSLLDDLRAGLLAVRRVLRHARIRRIVADLIAESERSPALADAIRPFQAGRRQRASAIIDRAIARGELPPEVDRETAADLIAAPLFWRMVVLGRRTSRIEVDQLATAIHAALNAEQPSRSA